MRAWVLLIVFVGLLLAMAFFGMILRWSYLDRRRAGRTKWQAIRDVFDEIFLGIPRLGP